MFGMPRPASPVFPNRVPELPYVGGGPRFRVTDAVLERHRKSVRAHVAVAILPSCGWGSRLTARDECRCARSLEG